MEKEKVTKIPVKWFIIGFLILILGTAWQYGYMWDSHVAWNRHENAQDDLYDDGFFIGFLMLFGLIPAIAKLPVEAFVIAYTFWHLSFTTEWIGRSLAIYPLSWYKMPDYAHLLPSWFSIPPDEVNKFLLGGVPNYGKVLPVFAWWTIMAIVILFEQYFWSAIWRRKLIEVDRLTFPWQQPTIELIKSIKAAGSEGNILKNKMLWYGFALSWLIYIWDIFHLVTAGAVPRLPLYQIFWGNIYADLTPVVGGALPIAFNIPNFLVFLAFIPLDILQTLFIWMWGWYFVYAAIVQAAGIYPRVSDRGWGAVSFAVRGQWFPQLASTDLGVIFGIAIYFIWSGRGYLSGVIQALKGNKDLDDPGLSYKISVPAFIITLLVFWGLWIMSGAHVGWSLLAILMQLGAATGLMRMRGEFWRGGNGLGWGNGVLGRWLNVMNYTGPLQSVDFRQSPATFTTVALCQWASRDTDNWQDGIIKIPDSLKVSHDLGVSHLDKYIMAIIFIGTPIGLAFTVWLKALIGYSGNTVWYPPASLWSSQGVYTGSWLGDSNPYWYMGVAIGFIFMLLKARFAWWPLNPVAIAAIHPAWLNTTFEINILSAFVLKYLIWKLGGAKIQRTVTILVIGFLGAYFLHEMLLWLLMRFVVGAANIPPP